MTTFDDPIFDPWGPSGDPVRAKRWRSTKSLLAVPTAAPTPAASPAPLPPHVNGPAPAGKTGAREVAPLEASILSTLILPRLQALATKLELARHDTMIDERFGRSPPSVRFRLRPWAGPFDIRGEAGSVIEFVEDAGHLVARLWLDALRPAPSHECDIPSASVDGTRIDQLLLDFLGKALEY